jgi:integrase
MLCASYHSWRKVSPSTVRRDLGVLQSAIKHGIQCQLITRTVAVSRPPESPPRERWLTRSEAAMLLAGALGFQPTAYDVMSRHPLLWRRVSRPQYHLCLFILVGLYSGRRKEAILTLRWSKVDLSRGRIDFRRDGTAETKKKRGLCAIPPRLRLHLVRAKGNGHNIGHVILWEGEAIEDIKTAFQQCDQTSVPHWGDSSYVEAHSRHMVDAVRNGPFQDFRFPRHKCSNAAETLWSSQSRSSERGGGSNWCAPQGG